MNTAPYLKFVYLRKKRSISVLFRALCITGVILTLVFWSLSLLACKKQGNNSENSMSVLFVGNSLTYSNDLPAIVAELGQKEGKEIATSMLAFPNYALEDHWNDGRLQAMISTGDYDFVVIQQGPSSQEDGRTMLLDYGTRIKALCDSNQTRLAFFMVWPAYANLHTFDGVINNYRNAAAATNSLLCPVGQIWKDHFASTNDYSYYGPDLFHPSLKGSQAAARIIYDVLSK